MSAPNAKRLPVWLWALLLAGLAVVVGLLVFGDRRPEPGAAYRLDLTEQQRVDPQQVLFEETGSIKPDLEKPRALAAGPAGILCITGGPWAIVCDAQGNEKIRFDLGADAECVAVAPDGDICVGFRDHVEVFDVQGARKATWEALGGDAWITSIAVNEQDVYVGDAGNRVVWHFDRAGQLLGRIGEKDEAREIPGFVVPSPHLDVAFDGQGELWAVNPGRHGLEQYRPDGSLASAWYRPSTELEGFCGCCNPADIAFRADSSMVTAEKGIARVKLYSPDQAFVGVVAGPEAFTLSMEAQLTGDLESPIRDLAVDAAGRVLVLDRRTGTVRIFEEKAKQP